MSKDGLISKVQRFTLGDGPGIRTTVFMQGCNLRCPWCHNPETIAAQGSILLYERLCSQCGACGAVCPEGIIQSCRISDRGRCTLCGRCEAACPNSAIAISGKKADAQSVLECVMEDMPFYRKSSGGVTISGGEPLQQTEFVAELSRKCHEHGVGVIIDTAGNVPFSSFEQLIPFVQGFYYDIKSSIPDYEKIGGDGGRVYGNLARLSGLSDVTVRIPVIPGYNDAADSMEALANDLAAMRIREVHLLPFHRLASGKYHALNLNYAYADIKSRQDVSGLVDIFTGRNLNCTVDG